METEQLREIDIRNYWPPVVGNTDEFQQVAEAENPEFNTLQACIWRALQDSFVQDATEYGVKRWEKILNISPENGDTIETRKERILTHLNIKLSYTWRVLKQMLIGLLGEDNFTMTINNDTATLTVAVGLDTTEAQIADVKTLLDRVLPRNLVTEMEWADGLPMSYTRLEYLTGSGYQLLDTNLVPNDDFIISTRLQFVEFDPEESTYQPVGWFGTDAAERGVSFGYNTTGFAICRWVKWNSMWCYSLIPGVEFQLTYKKGEYIRRNFTNDTLHVISYEPEPIPADFSATIAFGHNKELVRQKNWKINYRWHEIYDGETLLMKLIPAIDNTGTPCMFDLVSRKTFYNSGTGDFLYPTDAAPAAAIGLDDKFYAQLTEHGVRRLYRVPKGYAGSVDEYAAQNGFKELVEPPMPLEGYWMPEWRETETQLILDWIETEPPTEEVTENE